MVRQYMTLLVFVLAPGGHCVSSQVLNSRHLTAPLSAGTKRPTGTLGIQQVRDNLESGARVRAGGQLNEHGAAGPAAAATSTPSTDVSPAASCQEDYDSSTYVETDLRPLRSMWNSSSGYCGEASVQMIALARGVWVSQRQARLHGTRNMFKDLILERRDAQTGVYYLLAERLGFDQPSSSYWDKNNQTLTPAAEEGRLSYVGTVNPTSRQYMSWVKQQIIEGRPVISAVRIDTRTPDVWYDHIVPIFGVCSVNTNAKANVLPADAFSMSSDYKDEQLRPLADTKFFAEWQQCPYDFEQGQVGCIASDTYNFGVAMGGLSAPAGLYMPSRLTITAWSDGSDSQEEPGEWIEAVGSNTFASYSLAISGLAPGTTYTTYRLSGLLTGYNVPVSAAALAAECAAKGPAGCRSSSFKATEPAAVKTQVDLGSFPANGIQYFLTVEGGPAVATDDAEAAVAAYAADADDDYA